MRAGRLKDRVTIQNPPTQDSYGQLVGDWTDYKIRHCAIEPLNGKEYFSNVGEVGEQRYRIRFRYEKNLISKSKRLADYRYSPARLFDIEDIIIPANRNVEIIVVCKEVEA